MGQTFCGCRIDESRVSPVSDGIVYVCPPTDYSSVDGQAFNQSVHQPELASRPATFLRAGQPLIVHGHLWFDQSPHAAAHLPTLIPILQSVLELVCTLKTRFLLTQEPNFTNLDQQRPLRYYDYEVNPDKEIIRVHYIYLGRKYSKKVVGE